MTDRRVLAHVLRRVTFGPTAAEVDAAEKDGLGPVFAVPALPAMPSVGPDPVVPKGASMADRQKVRAQVDAQVADAAWWWVDRMVSAGGTAAERLVFFWHGHWATSVQKVRSANLMLEQQKTFRKYGFGSTGPLVRAMLRDPALIVWLDGQKNTRKAANENLAREVMELFTLGVDHYTEDDVKAAAKVLTGWTVDRAAGTSKLVAARHSTAPVTLLGRTGVLDVDGFADLLVGHPDHRPFVASRVWARYGSMSVPVPTWLSGSGADALGMLRTLAGDASFPETAGTLVKQPVEWIVGALRQLGVKPSGLADKDRKVVTGAFKSLGQVPLRPPSVGGWPEGEAWLTTASAQARLRLGQAFAGLAPSAVETIGAAGKSDRLDAMARMLAVDAWTPRTTAVLNPLIGSPRDLLALGLATPEYAVS